MRDPVVAITLEVAMGVGPDAPKRVVSGFARGSWRGLAIHESKPRQWSITQASSGLAAMLGIPRKDSAIAIADSLAPLADWTRDPLELTKDRAFLDAVIPATRELRALHGGHVGGSRKRRPIERDEPLDDLAGAE